MPVSDAITRLVLPSPALSSCVRCFIERNTVGTSLLDSDRYSHYPATPLCSIGWWWVGTAHYLAPGHPAEEASPRQAAAGRVVLTGPHTRPSISWNPGPAHGVMMMLHPEAFAAVTGIAPGQLLNQSVCAYTHLGAAWGGLWERVFAEPDLSRAQSLIEPFLLSLWSARPTSHARPLREWLQHLAHVAWHSDRGRSLRQMERRIKQWTGQSHRDLHVLARAETAFLRLMAQHPEPVNWAEAAVDCGYADQSHLGRTARRVTGFSPESLRRRMWTEEPFWMYRLWS